MCIRDRGIHSQPTDVRRRKSDEGILRTALGQKFRIQFPLKNFGARMGGSVVVRNCTYPPGFPTAPEREFWVIPVHFYGRFHFRQNFTQLWGAVAPLFKTIKDGNSKISSGHPIFVGKRWNGVNLTRVIRVPTRGTLAQVFCP